MAENEVQLRAESLYKVFGRSAESAIKKLESGTDRDDLGEGTTAAVIDASFEVRKGEIFVVMGLSGSGKSTLIRMLNGLLEPTHGTVDIGGEPLTGIPTGKLREIRRRKVSMVFQHFGLLPHRSVIDNVAYGLEIQGLSRKARLKRAREVVHLVGLSGWENHLPSELSGGMRQRVGLARALASDTDVLLMDEAFSALDPLIRREMQEQLLDLQSRLGKTIIFITHDLNEAMFLGERIAVMRSGRIVQIGAPEEILTDPANDYVAQFVQDVDRARVLTAGAVMEHPLTVVQESAGPRAALRVMRDEQTSAAFVVGRDRKLLGAITDRKALELVRAGKPTTDDDLIEAAHVETDTTIADLVAPAIESPLPLAVVDADGHLVGVVPRVTLLAALGGDEASEAVAAQPYVPLPAADVETALGTENKTEGGL